MATLSSTVSPTAAQIKYVCIGGIEHVVNTGQTFVLKVDDNSATDVRYSWGVNSVGVTTTDGYVIDFLPMVGAGGNNERLTVGPLADAQDGVLVFNPGGELPMRCSNTNIVQNWIVREIQASNVDFNSAGTLVLKLKDQFGNRMELPFQLIGTLAVGQAA